MVFETLRAFYNDFRQPRERCSFKDIEQTQT